MQISKKFFIEVLKLSAIGAHEHNIDNVFNKAQQMIEELESMKIDIGEMEILEIVGNDSSTR